MKKLLLVVALLGLMVGPAAADVVNGLVDGGFTGDGYHDDNVSYLIHDHLNDGWVTKDWGYDTANDKATHTTDVGNYSCIGQAFESSATGNQTLSVTWLQTTTVSNKLFYIEVWGVNSTDFSAKVQGNQKPLAAPTGTSWISVGSFTSTGGVDYSAGLTTDVTVAMSDTYDYYALRISARKLSGAEVSNVAITPEPATMSLLVLGGLGMLFRRKRK